MKSIALYASISRDVVIQSVLERVDGRRFHNVRWKRVPTVHDFL